MHAMNHNWSARKHRLHLQSAAGISRHSALSQDMIRQCRTSFESRHKDSDLLTSGIILNHLEWLLNQISRACHYATIDISEMIQVWAMVTAECQ